MCRWATLSDANDVNDGEQEISAANDGEQQNGVCVWRSRSFEAIVDTAKENEDEIRKLVDVEGRWCDMTVTMFRQWTLLFYLFKDIRGAK